MYSSLKLKQLGDGLLVLGGKENRLRFTGVRML